MLVFICLQYVFSVSEYQKACCRLGKLKMVIKSLGMLWNVSEFQKRTIFEGCSKLYCCNVVSLMYCIRYQISDVSDIVGPLLSTEHICSGVTTLFLFIYDFSELTNTINNPGRNNNLGHGRSLTSKLLRDKDLSFIPLQFIHLLLFGSGSSLFPRS